MTKSPAFQFYVKDWLSSRSIALMPPEYEGAYIRLLAYCWDSGDCSLPDDDDELAALSKLGERWLKGGSTVVRKCFIPHPHKPGHLSNQRLLDEAEKQAAWKNKSSEGGKKSAKKRAEKKEQLKGGATNGQATASTVVQPKANIASASSFASASASSLPSHTNPTTAPNTDYEQIYDYGVKLFPQLAEKNTAPINGWLADGGAVKEIILVFERERGKEPETWHYFDPAVRREMKARKAAPPEADRKPTPAGYRQWFGLLNSDTMQRHLKRIGEIGRDAAIEEEKPNWLKYEKESA